MKSPVFTLRTAIILPLMITLTLMSGIVMFIQSINYKNTLESVSFKELSVTSDSVKANLSEFLYPVFIISSALAESISLQFSHPDSDSESRVNFLFDTYTSIKEQVPQLDTLNVGLDKSGYYYGYRREADDSFSLILKDETTEDDLIVFDGHSTDSMKLFSVEDYDMHPRPWFAPVARSKKQMWSAPYINNDDEKSITLSALTPVFNEGSLYGVIAADIRLSTFNEFLAEQKQRFNRSIFIFDSEEHLVAQSEPESTILKDDAPQTDTNSPLSTYGGRRSIFNSSDPTIRLAAEAYFKNNKANDQVFDYVLDGEKYFAYVTNFKDDFGLDWNVVISTPESEVLFQLSQQLKITNIFNIIVTLLLCIVGFLFLTRITSSITQVAQAAKELAKRNWDTPLSNDNQLVETHSLVNSFNKMSSDLQTAFDDLHNQLAYDSLTNLYSREGLIDALKSQKDDIDGFIYIIAFNNFRDANDSLGYLKGDELLTSVANKINALDIDTEYYARIGGSEFAILVPNMKEADTLKTTRLLLDTFKAPISLGIEHILLDPVIGITHTNQDATTEQWLRQASIALSFAKKQQLTNVTYSAEMEQISLLRTKSVLKISEALEHNEFVPFYQPLVDLKTNEIIGAEALARWISPTDGVIPPMNFIPIAEESGLILQIGHEILLQACQDAKNEIEAGRWPEDFHLHVNIAVSQLASEQFIYQLKHILDKTQLNPKNLTLEVVESKLIDNSSVLESINTIRELGVGIAIDDFGTGYSSLAYLQSIPFDCLKIDRTFIKILTEDNCKNSIAAAILSLTKNIKNIVVVAEGIETAEQAKILSQLGCGQVQGFFYGRPSPLSEWQEKHQQT